MTHHRDDAITQLNRGRQAIVWFNYHWREFTRFDGWSFTETRLEKHES